MQWKYGEVILETQSLMELWGAINGCIDQGYKLGDKPLDILKNNTHVYALVVNDQNYIDVEYRVPKIEYTYITKDEYKDF